MCIDGVFDDFDLTGDAVRVGDCMIRSIADAFWAWCWMIDCFWFKGDFWGELARTKTFDDNTVDDDLTGVDFWVLDPFEWFAVVDCDLLKVFWVSVLVRLRYFLEVSSRLCTNLYIIL